MGSFPNIKHLKHALGKKSFFLTKSEPITPINTTEESIISANFPGEVVPTELFVNLRQIKISKKFKDYLFTELEGPIFLKILWTFNNFEESALTKECVQETRLKFDFKTQYKFNINENFINALKKNPAVFELFAENEETEMCISKAHLQINGIFDAVNKKINEKVVFSNSVIDPENIANLELWYKFACDKKQMKNLYSDMKLSDHSVHYDISSFNTLLEEEFLDVLSIGSDSEVTKFPVNKKKKNCIKSNDEEKKWLCNVDDEMEIDLLETLTEKKSDGDAAYQCTKIGNPMTQFAITVVELYFLEKSAPLIDKKVEQIYVEYAFLGEQGPEMEAPYSVPSGTTKGPSVFNFTKTFDIDMETNYEKCKLISNMVKNRSVIKFNVISEPEESLDNNVQICEELGYAEVCMEDIADLEDNVDIYQYEILSYRNPLIVIGYMTIKFEGILAMRKVALALMRAAHVTKN